AGALAMIADLSAFEETVPKIKDLRRDLRTTSFLDMLDAAMKAARKGDDDEAATLLIAALNASSAPEKMRTLASNACDSLKAKHYGDAEIAFQRALADEARSKLAQRGVENARVRRADAEKKALATVKSGSGDEA